VHDPRPLSLLPALDRAAEEAVDECPAGVAGGRVHDDARRLVDDQEVLVLIGDPEIEILGLER
jgi:hypothetical protein